VTTRSVASNEPAHGKPIQTLIAPNCCAKFENGVEIVKSLAARRKQRRQDNANQATLRVPALPRWSWNATLIEGTSYRSSAPRVSKSARIGCRSVARFTPAGGTLEYRQHSIWALSARGAMALPMSDFELRLVRALDRCELKPGSADRRFCDTVSTMSRHQSQILLTEGQRAYLWRIAYRYRHRLVEDLSEEAERRAGILKQQDGNPQNRRNRAKYRGRK